MPVIRRAQPGDAPELSTFAREIFVETFGPGFRREDIDAYIADRYSPEKQRDEIDDPDSTILVVEEAGALMGFAHLARSATPESVRGASPIELKRFYVASALHGTGVAANLMRQVLGAARAGGADVAWLAVFQSNTRAVAFYEKMGFRRVGEQIFVLGSDPQADWIMARELGGDEDDR